MERVSLHMAGTDAIFLIQRFLLTEHVGMDGSLSISHSILLLCPCTRHTQFQV